jgi:hypothetical protein
MNIPKTCIPAGETSFSIKNNLYPHPLLTFSDNLL